MLSRSLRPLFMINAMMFAIAAVASASPLTMPPDCSAIICLQPVCAAGSSLVVPDGQCCPQCALDTPIEDCAAVICVKPVCDDGSSLVVPGGQCCPQCLPNTPDCSAVFCLPPVCNNGSSLVVPDGQCCPQCVSNTPDCSAVTCLKPVCKKGENLVVPAGQCCPQCQTVCSLKPDAGPCEAAVTQIFYNSTSDQCETFLYGGCEGNSNRFNTQDECEKACSTNQQDRKKRAPDCSTVTCLKPICAAGSSLVVPDGQCCPQCVACPPTCSMEFCSKNMTAMCSNPGPRQFPGCTGSCQLTYCHACYLSGEPVDLPQTCPTCNDLTDYLTDSSCFRQWADCVSASRSLSTEDNSDMTQETFRCYDPPCPRRG